MNRLHTWPLFVAATLLAACGTPAPDKDDTDDTEVDTQVADTDAVDTELPDTDVEDTDVPEPCAYDGLHTRITLDPSTATGNFFRPVPGPAVRGFPNEYTRWSLLNDTDGTVAVRPTENSAVIIEFDPPLVLQRATGVRSWSLSMTADPMRRLLGGDPVPRDLMPTVTIEGTLPSDNSRATVTDTFQLSLQWGWSQFGSSMSSPSVDDTLTCVRFVFGVGDSGDYAWGRVQFNLEENGDTTQSGNPLVPPPPM